MTQALAKRESLAVQTARELNISDARLQLVKDTFAKGATDDELSLFLLTAHRTGLDPAARQIFAIKRWDSSLKREAMSVQVSIDGFRLIADRTNKYVPGRETTFTYDKNDDLESATAYVKKFVGGEWHEIAATAFYSEYAQTSKDGNPNRMWGKMPRLMLGKCAESLALRKTFPAELSGLYTDSEMGTEMAEPGESAKPATVHQMPTKTQLVEAANQTDARRVLFTPEVAALRSQLEGICRQAGKSDKYILLSLNKFDSLKTLGEKENAVAAVRQSLAPEISNDAERELLIAQIAEWMTEKQWEEGELEQFWVENEIESGLVEATTENLRNLGAKVLANAAEPIDGQIVE